MYKAAASGVRLEPTRRGKSLPAARAWRLHSGARRAADPRGATDPCSAADARAARGADRYDLTGLLRLGGGSGGGGGPHAHHAHVRTEPPRQSRQRRRRPPHHLGKGRRPSSVRPYSIALAPRPFPLTPLSRPSPLAPPHPSHPHPSHPRATPSPTRCPTRSNAVALSRRSRPPPPTRRADRRRWAAGMAAQP